MSKIKYCIWDVGEVMYKYSLDPLHTWCKEHTQDTEVFEQNRGKFSYNDYMKGSIPFNELCQQICNFYQVEYKPQYNLEINKAFHQGVGEYFPETREAQESLKKQGIQNCILSNALPILANTSKTQDITKQEHIFCSFDLGLLKPDLKIYETVLQKLGCHAEEVIFVDDKEKNTKAATSLGINAITFNCKTIKNEINKILTKPNIDLSNKG